MRSIAVSVMALMAILLAGCRPPGHFHTHVLNPLYKHVLDSPATYWIFADLQGNEEEYFIATDNQFGNINSLYVFHPNGKTISQLAMSQKFRGLRALTDPRNGNRWLFYSFNDQRRVTVTGLKYTWEVPLKREEKLFESIARTDARIDDPSLEWFALVYPEILEDIDGDGKLEMVCRMLDGYMANPRGLVVYDFDSGKIKWRFDTSANFSSVLLADHDGDGSKEFIISSQAVMNTSAAINGFDDQSGRVAVLDTSGKVLYQEKLFDGYGDIQLTSIDPDQDGRPEIYAIISTWGARNNRNSVIQLKWENGHLRKIKTWALGTYFDRGAQPYQFQDLDGSGTWRLPLVDKGSGLVVLDENLKPVKHGYKDFIKQIWAVEDITQDGVKEILLLTADNNFVVLDHHFRELASLKSPFPGDERTAMQAVKTGFSKPRTIALWSKSQLQYFELKVEPFYKLAFRMLAEYLWVLTLLLAMAMLYACYIIYYNWKMFACFGKEVGLGVVNSTSKGRVRRMNAVAMSVLSPDPDKLTERSLARLHPELARLVKSLVKSRENNCETTLELEDESKQKSFRVLAYKQTGLNRGVMLILFPRTYDLDADKAVWADTARRLSHHVRRHITNVILALPRLEDENDGEDKKEFLDIIRDEIEKIRVFTHSFQRFTELKDYDLKAQDIIPSLEHVVARITLPDSITLIKNWKLNSVHAFIEPIRFEEALTNLINNAVEAMPEGGILHVSAKVFPHHTSPKGPLSVLVEIEDSGVGIPAKYMDEIWKPFFTTNQSGTGIGLPESCKIITSMGGEISVQSEEGVGTVVSVWLKGEGDDGH